MRARLRRARPTPPPTLPTLTAIPAGYAILPFGPGHVRPVLIVATGDGLWATPLYRELSLDGRTGAVCASREEALAVIARHRVWRMAQDEVERGMARQQMKVATRKGGR